MNSNQSRINLDQIKSQVFTDSDGDFFKISSFHTMGSSPKLVMMGLMKFSEFSHTAFLSQ